MIASKLVLKIAKSYIQDQIIPLNLEYSKTLLIAPKNHITIAFLSQTDANNVIAASDQIRIFCVQEFLSNMPKASLYLEMDTTEGQVHYTNNNPQSAKHKTS